MGNVSYVYCSLLPKRWHFVPFSWKTGRMRATCTITKTEKRRGCTVSLGQIKCADQPHCTSRSLPNWSRLSIRLNFSSDWIPSLQNIFILFAFVGKSANIVFVLMHQFLFNLCFCQKKKKQQLVAENYDDKFLVNKCNTGVQSSVKTEVLAH